jgi:hypothetical protein
MERLVRGATALDSGQTLARQNLSLADEPMYLYPFLSLTPSLREAYNNESLTHGAGAGCQNQPLA